MHTSFKMNFFDFKTDVLRQKNGFSPKTAKIASN